MVNVQVVYVNFLVELVGGYIFGMGDFGMQLIDIVIIVDVVFVDDGSGEMVIQGCGVVVNGVELEGKIVLVDCGSCQFGIKCLNVEMVGVIGVIIFNNQFGVGVINMVGGDDGGMVIVFVVMLDYEVGQAICIVLESGVVNIIMGNLVLLNDIGVGVLNVMVVLYGVVFIDQVIVENFMFVFGVNMVNNGFNVVFNFNVLVMIEYVEFDGFNLMEVYSEVGMLDEIIDLDFIFSLLMFVEFILGNGIGCYIIIYQVVSDSIDQFNFDNFVIIIFVVIDLIYCKGGWDFVVGCFNVMIYYFVGGGGVFEMFFFFKFLNGSGLCIDIIIVDVFVLFGFILVGELFEVYVYEWNDVDEDGFIVNIEVLIVGVFIVVFFDIFFDQVGELILFIIDFNIFLELGLVVNLDVIFYFVGICYIGEGQAFIGVDESYSY